MHSVLIELLTSRMSMHSTHSLNKKIHYTLILLKLAFFWLWIKKWCEGSDLMHWCARSIS